MIRALETCFKDGYIYLYRAYVEIEGGTSSYDWTTALSHWNVSGSWTSSSGSSPTITTLKKEDEEKYLIYPNMKITQSEIEDLLLRGYNKVTPNELGDLLMVDRL